MAKYYGRIGFALTEELRPGVWEDIIVEKRYFGDVSKDTAKWRQSEYLHKNISASNVISVVADAYIQQHIFALRYIEWSGSLWEVAEAVVQHPRIDIRLGGIYNGPTAED